MCFVRKSGLGRYSGTRSQWRSVYRSARCSKKRGDEADYTLTGLAWKATLVVFNERNGVDNITIPAVAKLAAKRIINELLAEERKT